MAHSLKILLFFLISSPLFGHGENPIVTSGEAIFENPEPQIQQIRVADKTAINFQKFNIAKDETTRFIQPHAKARVLCRVTGGDSSIIEGRLEANGRLFLSILPALCFERRPKSASAL